jgi:hypothetical protein
MLFVVSKNRNSFMRVAAGAADVSRTSFSARHYIQFVVTDKATAGIIFDPREQSAQNKLLLKQRNIEITRTATS